MKWNVELRNWRQVPYRVILILLIKSKQRSNTPTYLPFNNIPAADC